VSIHASRNTQARTSCCTAEVEEGESLARGCAYRMEKPERLFPLGKEKEGESDLEGGSREHRGVKKEYLEKLSARKKKKPKKKKRWIDDVKGGEGT